MKVLTYTSSYKEHYELYTEIHGSTAVNGCQIGLFKTDKILLEDNILMKYSNSSPSGTFGLNDFNAKFKAAVLRQKQLWNMRQIKNLKLAVPENYAFTFDNNFFIALGAPEKIF